MMGHCLGLALQVKDRASGREHKSCRRVALQHNCASKLLACASLCHALSTCPNMAKSSLTRHVAQQEEGEER